MAKVLLATLRPPLATVNNVGLVKPDGTTITADADGTLHGSADVDMTGYIYALDDETAPTASEAIIDAEKLGGQLPAFYAKQMDLDIINEKANVHYNYDGIKSTNQVFADMPDGAMRLFKIEPNTSIANEIGITQTHEGGTIILFKNNVWRGSGFFIPLNTNTDQSVRVAEITGNNTLSWLALALKNDLVSLSNTIAKAAYVADLMATYDTPIFAMWDSNTNNTPYKAGLTPSTLGFAICYGNYKEFQTIMALALGTQDIYIHTSSNGVASGWVKK